MQLPCLHGMTTVTADGSWACSFGEKCSLCCTPWCKGRIREPPTPPVWGLAVSPSPWYIAGCKLVLTSQPASPPGLCTWREGAVFFQGADGRAHASPPRSAPCPSLSSHRKPAHSLCPPASFLPLFPGVPEAAEWPDRLFPEVGGVPRWLWEPGGRVLAG